MIEKIITVNLEYGLHARPSAYIVGKITPLRLKEALIIYDNIEANLKSILNLLLLGVTKGAQVKIKLSGEDESKALEILENIFNEKDNSVIYH